ncbi:MAG: SagB/ThcOx family dehydrogenase [Promethearchaeota archaeon]
MKKKKNIIRELDNNLLSTIFHENTKLFFSDKIRTFDIYPDIWKKIHLKSYPRFKRILLPKKFTRINQNIEKIIISRKSTRKFSGRKILFNDLSKLLFYSAGIRNKVIDNNWDESRRTYPSAGARYPLEIYIAIFNVENIPLGLYHYNVKEHSLELIKSGNFINKLVTYCNNQKWIKKANLLILISAIFARNQIKYKNRGYRYIFLDAGHMAQNFYLVTNSINLKCCAIGGFLDDEINKLINLDGKDESIIYIIAVGN